MNAAPIPVRTISFLALLILFAAACQTPNRSRNGLLENNTLFTVYGRGFGVAPILGRLGTYKDIDAMADDAKKWTKQISAVNGGKNVVTGIHLIYALAVPCTGKGDCLAYLSEDIVEKYIKPAAARGWVVVLDDQLGLSNPVEQIRRMISAGYMKYDNVHVAFDPEFHALPGQHDPGIPIGTITASQINQVQQILNDYVQNEGLKTKKIVIMHQFGDLTVHDGVPFMIQEKKTLRDFQNVELVIDADGLGPPAVKVRKYDLMTNNQVYPFIHFRGIKIFLPNPLDTRGHVDKPPMSLDEVFGLKPVSKNLKISVKPNLVIIA